MIYVAWPKSGVRSKLLPIFILFTCYFGAMLVEKSARSKSDLNTPLTVCGKIQKYGFENSYRGEDTWRLYVITPKNGNEVFRVGAPYIHESVKKHNMQEGSNICVNYINQYVDFSRPFITQITLGDVSVLDYYKVAFEYLSAPSLVIKTFVLFSFIFTVLSIFRVGRKQLL
ncbi:hypothetical protein CW745_16070 [Psychromonas sp. psych-6C06]|uniref:hypothetical protein n=1 Tax=Psychromonas sp. psych-6C06 TaxID=2058089 RepID=UPI000C3395A6|nr:hypothetical protein [Psychromonas sp. psych-6C06]PKF60233.1 hypothetical protein CW745_16070 [Psychromonas sp. psych-6C06]